MILLQYEHIMNKTKNKPALNIIGRLTRRYRVTIQPSDTTKSTWSATTSQLQVISMIVVAVCTLGFVIFALFAWTPLHNILPGYLKSETRVQIIDNALRVDSLNREIDLRERYIDNIARILTDEIPMDSIMMNDSIAASLDSAQSWTPEILSKSSPESEAFSRSYEKKEQFNLTMLPQHSEGILFHTPVKGKVIETFAPANRRYGIKIAPERQASATAVLDGTVVSVTHTISRGYVVVLQHNNNYMSIYGNIGDNLRQVGDKVVAGERIGSIGTATNKIAEFELWHAGVAVDPMKYIIF